MLDGLVETTAAAGARREPTAEGIAIAQVVDNVDTTNRARVQVRLPWLPDFQPWARVAAPNAGSSRGIYFMPQIGDEVIVAFNHGDIREPIVLGSVWNGQDSPPSDAATDAVTKRIIRTPAGHEVRFDDTEQSITITSSTKQTVTMSTDKIVASTANSTASVTLETAGKISLQASVSIEINAPTVAISGTTVELTGDASAKVEGSGMCTIKGGLVAIN